MDQADVGDVIGWGTLENGRALFDRRCYMENNRLLDAAEACFEVDPSPKNEEWIARNFVPHLYHTKAKKVPCTTQVPHQKCTKMYKNDQK